MCGHRACCPPRGETREGWPSGCRLGSAGPGEVGGLVGWGNLPAGGGNLRLGGKTQGCVPGAVRGGSTTCRKGSRAGSPLKPQLPVPPESARHLGASVPWAIGLASVPQAHSSSQGSARPVPQLSPAGPVLQLLRGSWSPQVPGGPIRLPAGPGTAEGQHCHRLHPAGPALQAAGLGGEQAWDLCGAWLPRVPCRLESVGPGLLWAGSCLRGPV